MPTPMQPPSSAEASVTSVNGLRIQARSVGQRIRGAGSVLHDVSLDLAPGRLTVIAGSSGAGKTILLQTLAGLRAPTEGTVLHDGTQPGSPGPEFGFVPQEDIIHRELPLRRTLVYAAGLRMPPGTTPEAVAASVDRVLEALGLSSRAATPVRALSGGERKRASIAAELLTRPRVLFLDEPTSGLDPVTGAALLRTLRALAEDGTTVVLTTHTLADLLRGDQVVFLSPGGEVAYAGEPGALCGAFGVGTVEEVYEAVAEGVRVERADPSVVDFTGAPSGLPPVRRVGAVRQWALLTRRGTALLLHNRLSVAVLAGSPVMIVAMFAVLFRAGAFDRAAPDPGSTAMIMFWIAFGAFFFGLTYGLLQICTELPVLRREWLAGLRIGPYVASKLTTMLPVLAVADVLLLLVLRALDRLPAAGWGTYGSLFVSSVLASAAALALGLLASAAVTEPGQATLMLPLLCFPQVLFSGAFVPVPRMTGAGEAISWAMTNRWAFEALGSGVGLESLWGTGASPLGPPLLDSYGDSFGHPASRGWLILAGFTVLFLAVTWAVLVRKCRQGAVRSRAGR
ncbi:MULTISPECIES: ATP-binding cassette domain-containing protein [unclassified Streptomyces]|uniref:ATP-binding cassette domain-containing protein n=1 Tax=unclassified Streptomyces TaxID=2593676 RepID=UPI0022549FCD|nr:MULTISPECIES: ATP-binding cassette domain-containing protein [unclassified Streptomyces]MCX4403122.1 ATP-binding cassette domain-containing protein [Streptomyces sp. NBC_01764]MCX5181904.1 ATP-binding cassette domain-containing protein [Streptomyces sp. NBC_00268]